jgi:hypothetical protein
MLDYTLPPAFREQKAMDMQDVRAVLIAPEDASDDRRIMLEDGAPGLNDPEYREQVEASGGQAIDGRRYDTRLISTEALIIRGQPAPLNIREGQDDRGRQVRQATIAFRGKQGDVLLVVVGPLETWDQALVEQFIKSIR